MQDTNELVEHLGCLAVDLRRRCDPDGAALCFAAIGTILTSKDGEAVAGARREGFSFAAQVALTGLFIVGFLYII